jgi:hypothetical protein
MGRTEEGGRKSFSSLTFSHPTTIARGCPGLVSKQTRTVMVGSRDCRAEQNEHWREGCSIIIGLDIEASSCALIMQDAGHCCIIPFQPDL